MANTYDEAFVQQYSANVQMLSQQVGSRLASKVRVEPVKGYYGYFDQVGSTSATKRTQTYGSSGNHPGYGQGNDSFKNTPHVRRQVPLYDYDWADLIDEPDKVRSLIDPTNAYALAASAAMTRAKDDELIAAALGTAKTGKEGGTSVTWSSQTNQIITHGSAGMTISKILTAKEIMDGNEVDERIPRIMAISSKQVTELLNSTEVKSSDYNTVKALAAGQINTFAGFEFVRSERLNLVTGSPDYRQCFAFAADGLLLGIGMDVKARITERADYNYATQVFFSMVIGATRMEEKKVVEIQCQET